MPWKESSPRAIEPITNLSPGAYVAHVDNGVKNADKETIEKAKVKACEKMQAIIKGLKLEGNTENMKATILGVGAQGDEVASSAYAGLCQAVGAEVPDGKTAMLESQCNALKGEKTTDQLGLDRADGFVISYPDKTPYLAYMRATNWEASKIQFDVELDGWTFTQEGDDFDFKGDQET